MLSSTELANSPTSESENLINVFCVCSHLSVTMFSGIFYLRYQLLNLCLLLSG